VPAADVKGQKVGDAIYRPKHHIRFQDRNLYPLRVKSEPTGYGDEELSDVSLNEAEVTIAENNVSSTMASEDTVTQIMRMMLEDRRREKEERDEREKRVREEREAREERDLLERLRQEERERDETMRREQFMTMFIEGLKRDDKVAAQKRQSESRIDRVIARLPRMSDGDDLEEFVMIVEAELLMEEVPKEQWKTALLGCLTQKAKGLVKDIILDQHSTYQVIKNRLLDCTGLSQSMAGEYLFSQKQVVMGTDLASSIQTVLRWLDRSAEGACTKREVFEKLAIAKI